MNGSNITCHWREREVARGYTHGVSLHSHTNCSRETLDFIAELGKTLPFVERFLASRERRCAADHNLGLDFARAYWTPVLTPRLAFDLERRQIEDQLGLPALVSISDHDDIAAPLLLRSVDTTPNLPISLEWTAPIANTAFHLGIHNLPAATAADWMARLADFTATPTDNGLISLLEELNNQPNVLIIFNHPIWDLYRIGAQTHNAVIDRFLRRANHLIHALELNGLRNWKENEAVIALAERWHQLLISGGDRHGVEPNANVNLTDAINFTDFVYEVRCDRRSHIHFMPQYAEPWKHRVLDSTLAAVRNYPDLPEGSRRWDERVFHPDVNGNIVPVSSLWPQGRPPHYIGALIASVRLLGCKPIFSSLKLAMGEPRWARTEQTT